MSWTEERQTGPLSDFLLVHPESPTELPGSDDRFYHDEGGRRIESFFKSADLWGSSLAKWTQAVSPDLGDSILYHERVFTNWFYTILKMEFSECFI